MSEVTSTTDGSGNLIVTVTLTPNEQTFLNNDLTAIDTWVEDAIVGKTSKCKKRMVNEWDAKLRADKDVTAIPTDETTWLTTVTERVDYKDRVARDAIVAIEK